MTKEIDTDNKYELLLVLIISFVFIFITIAIFLSNYDSQEKVEGNVAVILNDGDLVINYVDGEDISFYDKKEHEYNVSITNNGSTHLYYSVYLMDCNTTKANIDVENEDGEVVNSTTNPKDKLLNLLRIESGVTVRYKIKIKNSSRSLFKCKLKVVNESLTTQIFSDLILLNHQVTTSKTRIGSDIATEYEGLLSTEDDLGTSFFFRGAVDDNYVKLGDLLFRIVRVNGDESVRLVLDDVLEVPYSYNTNPLKKGNNAGNLTILTISTLKPVLDKWYKDNLSFLDDYIVEGKFCADNTFTYTINGTRYSNAYERVFVDDAPELVCKGYGYNTKVGLLSADEVVFAGASHNTANVKYYLYNSKIESSYFTLSTYAFNSNYTLSVINVMPDGSLGTGTLINSSSYIRPVINISVSAKVKGNGTIDNPFIIVS